MSIQVSCPHCNRSYRVKDELAGKRATCSACKKAFQIPKPAAMPELAAGPAPGDVEALAAAALADEPAPAPAPPADSGTVDFRCPHCDEEVHVSGALAGKQAPCPACRRIIRVPMPVKDEPKDWRTVASRGPSGVRQNVEPTPEGAWGTSTSVGTVSRDALIEAGAVPERREPWSLSKKIKVGSAAAAGVALVALLGWYGWRWNAQGARRQAIERALQAVANEARPDTTAEVHRAAGEFYLRDGKGEEASKEFVKSRTILAELPESADRDSLLIDLALTQVDLGSADPEEIDSGARIKWDTVQRELGRTLGNLGSPEARIEGVRLVARKLITRGQKERVQGLAGMVVEGNELPEAQAIVGLELLRAGAKEQAEAVAEQAQLPVRTASREEGGARSPSSAPTLVALLIALDKVQQADALKPKGDKAEPTELAAWTAGFAEGLARKGRLADARKMAADARGSPQDRLRILLAVAGVALEQEPPDPSDVDAIVQLAKAVPRAKNELSWPLLRLARLCAWDGLPEQANQVAAVIPDPAAQARARFEGLLGTLRKSPGQKADVGQAETVAGKERLAHGLALESIARHNVRAAGARDTLKAVEGWREAQRPFGFAGVALGLQDTK
jgi:hypothetical protein